MDSRKPLLYETFGLSYDESGAAIDSAFNVELFNNEIVISSQTRRKSERRIDLTDVIGAHAFGKDNRDRAYLIIYAYPKNAALKGARCRQKLTLFYDPVAVYDQSLLVVNHWKQTICFIVNFFGSITVLPEPATVERFITGKMEDISESKRRYLIVLNPVSGSSEGNCVFRERVASMLQEAEINYSLLTTEYSGHAKFLIQNEPNLFSFDGLVAASGDGLMHEIINGLFARGDWKEATKIPLGVLPVGSANALSSMICFLAGEETLRNHIYQATFLLTRPVTPKPMDLLAIDSAANGRLYSFLWLAWGIISDIDIESEDLRFLGGARFAIETLVRIAGLRHYHGKVSFLPFEEREINNSRSATISAGPETKHLVPLDHPVPANWKTIEDDFIGVIATHCSHLASDFVFHKKITYDDGSIWLILLRSSLNSRRTVARMFRAMGQGQGLENCVGIECYRVKAFRVEPGKPKFNSGHILTVDGEKIGYAPVQGQILAHAARLL